MSPPSRGSPEAEAKRTGSLSDEPAAIGRLRFLIVDDHRLFAESLASVLEDRGFEVVGVAASGLEAVAVARATTPDFVLMDLGLPDIDGLTAGRRILRERPDTRILAMTGLKERGLAAAAVRNGFHGYLNKRASLPDLLAAITAESRSYTTMPTELARSMVSRIERGDRRRGPPPDASRLTPREREVLVLLGNGARGREIAHQLGLSPATVRNHIQNILTKLRLHSRLEAVALAPRLGLGVAPGEGSPPGVEG